MTNVTYNRYIKEENYHEKDTWNNYNGSDYFIAVRLLG